MENVNILQFSNLLFFPCPQPRKKGTKKSGADAPIADNLHEFKRRF
jgi:hypothetical protein